MTVSGISESLRRKHTRIQWKKYKEERGKKEHRAANLRWWWKNRLREMGIDPLSLKPDEPLWRSCFRMPRGWLVRVVAEEMRFETPGVRLELPENTLELLRRVEVRTAADVVALATTAQPPDDVVAPVDVVDLDTTDDEAADP